MNTSEIQNRFTVKAEGSPEFKIAFNRLLNDRPELKNDILQDKIMYMYSDKFSGRDYFKHAITRENISHQGV
tara:strand:+ start:9177 stop:9392 length:216 start_codon:yes stop_codon:yes gene_type:complete